MATLRHVGFINEMGELDRRTDKRTAEFCKLAGMELVFTMHAREHAELLQRAAAILENGTTHKSLQLLDELVKLLRGVS